MKERKCDLCGAATKEQWHKVSHIQKQGNKFMYKHTGDICLQCWDKLIGGSNDKTTDTE